MPSAPPAGAPPIDPAVVFNEVFAFWPKSPAAGYAEAPAMP